MILRLTITKKYQSFIDFLYIFIKYILFKNVKGYILKGGEFVMKSKFKGFTLIELLIVVAIIAILAAIAVPNFLEAQVRSKVSRTKADMRSMATAIEAYYVDYNKYMPDSQFGALWASFLPRVTPLSTPIGYITTLPEDIFALQAINKSTVYDDAYRIPYGSGPLVRPYVFDFACRRMPNGQMESITVWARISSSPDTIMWAMRSVGPDLVATYLGMADAVVYDPTNGTVSFGDIFFTGPGKGIDAPNK